VTDDAAREQRLITGEAVHAARERACGFRAESETSRLMAASLRVEAALLKATLERSAAEVARSRALVAIASEIRDRHQQLWDSIERETAARPARPKRTREAHFAVCRLVIDGVPWPAKRATLDVYHRGPDYDDLRAAQWEVHFQPTTRPATLTRNDRYVVEVETRDGRCLTGKAFLQHAGEVWTLLDADHPLAGLRADDLD
jgi:hypothetical protein